MARRALSSSGVAGAAEQGRRAGGDAVSGARSAGVITFGLADRVFALRLDEVNEVIRPPRLVRMPLAPPSLLGLANLRGAVLPVISLRRLLGLTDAPVDTASRVIVADQAGAVGFLVDHVISLQTLPAEPSASVAVEPTADASDFVCGIVGGGADAPATLLDAGRLLQAKYAKIQATRPATAAASTAAAVMPRYAGDKAAAEASAAFISFFLDAQEFGLPLATVQEVIPAPADIAPVPRAETGVLGMVTLRDRLLPLVSLRALLGLAAASEVGPRKVVVAALGGYALGLMVDRTRDILRVSPTQIDEAPPLFSEGGGDAAITAICRLDGGRRLVRLLTAETLFKADLSRRLLADAAHGAARAGDHDSDGTAMSAENVDHEQFIIFQLAGQDYGLPLTAVAEVAPLPAAVTRLPKAPAFIEGVMNLRGGVVPLVDLKRRLDLGAGEPAAGRRVLILSIADAHCGFLVDRVREILRVRSDAVTPAPALAADDAALVTRVANLPAEGRLVLILEPARLLDRIEADMLKGIAHAAAEEALQAT